MGLQSLKPGWKTVQFGDIAQSVADRVDPSEATTDVYVGLEHLDPSTIHLRQWGHPSDVTGQKLAFKKGDVIFGRRRAYQRKLAVAEFDGICSAHAMVVRAKPKMILPEFLPFFLQSDMFMERAIEISVGSLSPTINWKALRIEEFPLPPFEQQKRIAEILWAADEVIERFLRAQTHLQGTMAAVFQHLVVSSNPATKKISDLGQVITGSTPATKITNFYDKHDFMFVSPADIGSDKFVCKTEKMVSSFGFQSGRGISRNAVMVVCIGSTTGKVAMSSERCITNQQINSVVCNDSANPDFVYRLLKQMGDYFFRQASCTALPILNKSQFSSVKVSLPPLGEQEKIVEKIRKFEKAGRNLDKHIANARAILDQIREGWLKHV